MERVVAEVLGERPAAEVFAHGGTLLRAGGQDGIGRATSVARRLGVRTTAVHPSVAMRSFATHRVSPDCDHVFFVHDEEWGGAHSPTLRTHLAVSDEIVVIGGGWHAAHELRAFAAAGWGRCAGPRSRCGSWDSGAIVPGRTAGRQRRVPCRAAPPCAGGQPGLRAVICRYSAW